MTRQVWIGLVGVTPRPDSQVLRKAKGGFVNALALAADESEYKKAVEHALDELGLEAFEFEDVETFSMRTSKWEVDAELRELADEVDTSGTVQFGTFHSYLGTE